MTLAGRKRDIDTDAHRTDDDDHRINRVVLTHVERIEQDVPGSRLPRDHLARDHRDQRQHQAGAAPRQNFRQRRRQHNLDQALEGRKPHCRARPQHLFLNGFGSLKAMKDDRQTDAEKDHQGLGDVADAEPQHDDGHQRRFWYRINHHQQWIEESGDRPAATHQEAKRNRDRYRYAKPDRHAA
jgi:hypothetical protein